jgi:hypothetical protein
MNDNRDDPRDGDVQLPTQVLNEQSLAVDLARADIDTQIATAHKYPRVLDTVIKKITTMACYNEAAAENCIYSLPRGGKPIIGPSIGFANIVATAWGNCIDASRMIGVDRANKVVIAEGLFHDLETNRKIVLSEQRRIVGKNGSLYSDDMIIVTSKAAGAIARRNAILQIVPWSITKPIWDQALQIVRGDMETFAERKDKALKAFAQFGVKPEQVFAVLGLKGDADLNLEHIPTLRGMYAALRDQSMTVEEMFDPRRMGGGSFERVSNPLGDDDDDMPPGATRSGKVVEIDHDAQTGEVNEPAAGESDADKAKALADAKAREKAEKKAAKEAAKAKPAGAPVSAEQGGRGVDDPGIANSPAEAAKPAEPALPKDGPGYIEYLSAWCAAATSATAVDERWKSPAERQLRTNCSVIEEDFEKARKIKDARIADLKKAG